MYKRYMFEKFMSDLFDIMPFWYGPIFAAYAIACAT